jgi:hypothetical protein
MTIAEEVLKKIQANADALDIDVPHNLEDAERFINEHIGTIAGGVAAQLGYNKLVAGLIGAVVAKAAGPLKENIANRFAFLIAEEHRENESAKRKQSRRKAEKEESTVKRKARQHVDTEMVFSAFKKDPKTNALLLIHTLDKFVREELFEIAKFLKLDIPAKLGKKEIIAKIIEIVQDTHILDAHTKPTSPTFSYSPSSPVQNNSPIAVPLSSPKKIIESPKQQLIAMQLSNDDMETDTEEEKKEEQKPKRIKKKKISPKRARSPVPSSSDEEDVVHHKKPQRIKKSAKRRKATSPHHKSSSSEEEKKEPAIEPSKGIKRVRNQPRKSTNVEEIVQNAITKQSIDNAKKLLENIQELRVEDFRKIARAFHFTVPARANKKADLEQYIQTRLNSFIHKEVENDEEKSDIEEKSEVENVNVCEDKPQSPVKEKLQVLPKEEIIKEAKQNEEQNDSEDEEMIITISDTEDEEDEPASPVRKSNDLVLQLPTGTNAQRDQYQLSKVGKNIQANEKINVPSKKMELSKQMYDLFGSDSEQEEEAKVDKAEVERKLYQELYNLPNDTPHSKIEEVLKKLDYKNIPLIFFYQKPIMMHFILLARQKSTKDFADLIVGANDPQHVYHPQLKKYVLKKGLLPPQNIVLPQQQQDKREIDTFARSNRTVDLFDENNKNNLDQGYEHARAFISASVSPAATKDIPNFTIQTQAERNNPRRISMNNNRALPPRFISTKSNFTFLVTAAGVNARASQLKNVKDVK